MNVLFTSQAGGFVEEVSRCVSNVDHVNESWRSEEMAKLKKEVDHSQILRFSKKTSLTVHILHLFELKIRF